MEINHSSSTKGMRALRGCTSESLSWKRRKYANENATIAASASDRALNLFENDGTFLQNILRRQRDDGEQHSTSSLPDNLINGQDNKQRLGTFAASDLASSPPLEDMSANQLAGRALQLRLQGKSREVEELLSSKESPKSLVPRMDDHESGEGDVGLANSILHKQSLNSIMVDHKRRMDDRESGDAGLAISILHNKQYSSSRCVDEEDDSVSSSFSGTVTWRMRETKRTVQPHKWIITQTDRCQFCFDNQSRPKHLTISIANSCYLMLPPWEPLADGHCLLVPMHHEGASRNLDEDVWEELRNYKKCLLQMFAKQGRDALFMETVINLAQQRRHCLIECIPLPFDKAEQAPLYFKKAINEAEDEWSQHDAKKLINTSVKGMRRSIPKNFPYFHVEFGLRAGYAHVMDDERAFRHDFGRNVVIGMLNLPADEMGRRRKQQTFDQQNKAVLNFSKDWAPFDWTKLLD